MKKVVVFFLTVSSLLELHAQTNYHHNVIWGRLVLADTINKNLRVEMLLQHRRQNLEENDLNVFAANQFNSYWPWLHYTLTPTTKISFSPIGYFESWILIAQPSNVHKEPIKEWRVSARIEQETRVKYFNLFNRYGLEYRQRDLLNNGIFQPNFRARYMVRLEKPIYFNRLKRPVTAVLNDEIFIQFGKAVRGNPNIFDQNRVYAGLNYTFSPYIKGSLGYVWGIQERNSGKEIDYYNFLWAIVTVDNVSSIFKKRRT
ncbi:DUF2490 domain-containing protein [Emticicia sp. C21]|uniref:DUF2490 domain-containing protein n=1 Tax=Emticicia sp. C21 TaxID=2302915 RepID=UPI000E3445CE|nr:DUF2490 domain-containing protein [Emticicia sp. C21]RFS18579.1 DUF2490 domain-containing protein [Emticicia sp. C21]